MQKNKIKYLKFCNNKYIIKNIKYIINKLLYTVDVCHFESVARMSYYCIVTYSWNKVQSLNIKLGKIIYYFQRESLNLILLNHGETHCQRLSYKNAGYLNMQYSNLWHYELVIWC